jgi:hypothetical protein
MIAETGNYPAPFTPSRDAVELAERLRDLHEKVERARKFDHPMRALNLLAIAGYSYRNAGDDPDEIDRYVRGVLEGIRRTAYQLIAPQSQGIA